MVVQHDHPLFRWPETAGPSSSLPEKYACVRGTHVPTLLPGLWDAHVHFLGCTTYLVDESATTSPALAGVRSARDIVTTLNSGYTSVREMAGYGVELRQVVSEGWIPGPAIYSAVAILSPTAGHADARSVPQSQLTEARECKGLPFFTCDGEAECVKAVRTMVRRRVFASTLSCVWPESEANKFMQRCEMHQGCYIRFDCPSRICPLALSSKD